MPVTDYHQQFASVYDTLYQHRDVAAEVRAARELLDLHPGNGADLEILDFGCGTGSHVLAFGAQEIRAAGFDVSPAMIVEARAKQLARGATNVRFETATSFEGCTPLQHARFRGAVSFFNVLNCIPSAEQMVRHLQAVKRTLDPSARFLVEVWNGAAVFREEPRPEVRHYTMDTDSHCEMIRMTIPTLDRVQQRCALRYRMLRLDRANRTFVEFESVHPLFFLTPVHYRHVFELAGLKILGEFPKHKPDAPITEHDWYISYLLQRAD